MPTLKLCITLQDVTNTELWNISWKKSENCLSARHDKMGGQGVQLCAFLSRHKQDVNEKLQAPVAEIPEKNTAVPTEEKTWSSSEYVWTCWGIQFCLVQPLQWYYKGCDKIIIIHVKYVLTTLRQISRLYL